MRKPLFATALLGALALSACTDLPPEVVAVGCALGPTQFPDRALEIETACALQAAATAGVAIANATSD